MTESQRLTIRSSEIREKLNELTKIESLTAEQRGEIDTLSTEYRDAEAKLRAAIIVEGDAEKRALEREPDAERRERLEMRGESLFDKLPAGGDCREAHRRTRSRAQRGGQDRRRRSLGIVGHHRAPERGRAPG